MLHQERNISLRGINLVLNQVGLKVFVGDKTISISIERSEDLESARLALAESSIFDLTENTTKSASCGFIFDVATSGSCKFSVDKSRRRVSSLAGVES